MEDRKTERLVVWATVLFALSAVCLNLARATDFDLDYLLLGDGDDSPVATYSGTNTLGLPYDQDLDTAEDLTIALHEATVGNSVVLQISRFLRTTDSLATYSGGSGNFTLVPAEGYRVVVQGDDIEFPITGSHDDDLEVVFYGAGETIDGEGTSNTGINEWAPPYHRVAEKASDVMEELNGIGCPGGGYCSSGPCPGGSCCIGGTPCCVGGSRGGKDCTPFVSISRFVIATDGFQTYAGGVSDLPNDFNLVVGESYRVQVTAGVAFVPDVFAIADVQVELENRPTSPCTPQYDGGLLRITNLRDTHHVHLQWHGGDPTRDQESGFPDNQVYSNLVFSPDEGPSVCGNSQPPEPPVDACVNVCPGPDGTAPGGCERITNCSTCGGMSR